jgi:uncharacterized Ntn-hydrolase superfamily protein
MTYSIVARDPRSGELGVAVQSHYFQVGPVVPWAQSGVGAVATQSQVNISYGPLGLEMMRAGFTAEQALRALTSGDPQADVRQCAIVDAAGNVAAHTGAACIPAAGHRTGEGFSCQANLMEKDSVWGAMAEAYTSTDEPLAERMMAALEAAEREGGDIRGRQSAAMLVVAGTATGRSWEERVIDLRVEDAPDPLAELRRLLRVKRAYMALGAAEEGEASDDLAAGRHRLDAAIALAPEMVEIRFWSGLTIAQGGDVEGGCEQIAVAVRKDRRWLDTLDRLVAVDRLDPDLASAIRSRLAASPPRI